MVGVFKLKLIINKRNGQINLNLPKKKLPKMFSENIMKSKFVKIKLEKLYPK